LTLIAFIADRRLSIRTRKQCLLHYRKANLKFFVKLSYYSNICEFSHWPQLKLVSMM